MALRRQTSFPLWIGGKGICGFCRAAEGTEAEASPDSDQGSYPTCQIYSGVGSKSTDVSSELSRRLTFRLFEDILKALTIRLLPPKSSCRQLLYRFSMLARLVPWKQAERK